MSRHVHRLTVAEARAIRKPGRHSDGAGLYLRVRKSGSRSWIFQHGKNGKYSEIGLGSFDHVTLADARAKSKDLADRVHKGLPLVEIVPDDEQVPTFLECVERFLEAKECGWKNDKHRAQWHMTLKKYGKPLHNMEVTDIRTAHVLNVIEPIWLSKNETASRLRGRIEAVMDYAKAMGWRSGENPAGWRGNLKLLLPQYSKVKHVKHHAAMSVEDIPAFMRELRERKAIVARLLEFIILTAARSGEARFATWDEIDLERGVWTVPKVRMKMGKEHQVPLSSSVLSLLENMKIYSSGGYIFEHPIKTDAFSINATRALLKRMREERLTTHGFRSTFRDWAGDKTYHQRELIESALAHRLKDKAEAAYRRSSALEKRRHLMQDWDDYSAGMPTDEV